MLEDEMNSVLPGTGLIEERGAYAGERQNQSNTRAPFFSTDFSIVQGTRHTRFIRHRLSVSAI